MADERRRQALRVSLETDGAVSLNDLAAEIARCERQSDTSAATKRIRTRLYHSHPPILADAGLVAYIANDEWFQLVYTGSPKTTFLLSDM